MSNIEETNVLNAAGAAAWKWSRAESSLTIDAETDSPLGHLSGEWTLAEFLTQIDGLAQSGVRRALLAETASLSIDQDITLRNGDRARLVGSLIDNSAARGLLISQSVPTFKRTTDLEGLEPVYQPIWDAKTSKLAGFEALARWRNKDGDLLGPDELDTHGLSADWAQIAPLMLDMAAKALVRFRSLQPHAFMQVNLSAAEIANAVLVREIEDLIRSYHLPRKVLRIELTEQAALRDVNRALGAFAAFRAAGAGLILDDFGAGHSSLNWLAEIPADGLKLDQKLTSVMDRPRGRVIITALVDLAHNLGMSVTAEGIETLSRANEMRVIGCDFIQGYLAGQPLCEDAIIEHLRANDGDLSISLTRDPHWGANDLL